MNQTKTLSKILLAVCMVAVGLFSGCNEEDDGLVSINLQPPSNIDAVFTISGDNTGTLTVSPVGAGASSFEILFGDAADEEPTLVMPGETAEHIYAEGDFLMSITGIGGDGQRTTATKDIVIRFDPPENLSVDLVVSNRSLTVTPGADGATLFEVLFGDEEDGEEATQVMPGESATHIYDAIGDYTVSVVARGAGAATAEFSQVVTIFESITLPIDFEADDITFRFTDFNGAQTEVVDNPDQGGNTSGKVARTTKTAGAATFAGTIIEVAEPLDFNTFKKVRVNVWSPKVGGIVKLKVENADDGNIAAEIDLETAIGSAWETLLFDFTEIDATQEYSKIIIFFDFGNEGDDTQYYFDGIELTNDGGPELALPLDFESSELVYSFENFGGATSQVIVNPDPSGINSSSMVGNLFKSNGSEVWAGSFIELDNPIDFSAGTTFRIKTWSPKAGATVRLKIENAADPNIFFEADATTGTASAWEELSWDFSGVDQAQDYQRVVIFFDFGTNGDGSDYFYDDITLGPETPVLGLPLDFESNDLVYTFENFGGAASQAIANPDPSGINASNMVAELTKGDGAEVWGGSFIELPAAMDFSSKKIFKIKTWSPKAGAVVRLKVENNADPNIFFEADANTTVTGQWEELTWDFSAIDSSQEYHRVVIFFDFGVNGDGSVYYYDDITLTN